MNDPSELLLVIHWQSNGVWCFFPDTDMMSLICYELEGLVEEITAKSW